MFDGRAFHSLAVVGKKTMSECVGRVSNLKKLTVMLCLIYGSSGMTMMICSILYKVVILLDFLLV